MKKFKDSLDKFKADVDDHEGDLQVVKQNRDEFVETCQKHDQAVSYTHLTLPTICSV